MLYVGHTARLSGGEIALARLLTALRGRVVPVVVLGEDGPLVPLLRRGGVDVVVLPLPEATRELRRERLATPISAISRSLSVVGYAFRLRTLIRQREVHIVHTNTLKAGFYGCLAARLAGVPSVWHVRDRLAGDYLPRLALLVVRLALAVLPTRIVCISWTTAETVVQGEWAARRARILVAPVYDVLESPAISRSPDREPQGSEFVVGMVGRLSPWKGQHVALRALAMLPFPARLVLVGTAMFGEHDYVRRLYQEVAELGLTGRVEFRGFVEDVLGALPEFDVLVHASTLAEPFGQVVVEGMAAGVPVVATRGGGPGEVITDEVDGLLYEAGAVPELAARLHRLRDDPALAHALAHNARVRVQDFAPAAVTPAVLAVYDDVLRGAARPVRKSFRIAR